MATSFVLAVLLLGLDTRGAAVPAHVALIFTVAITTFVWLAATWLTPPTDDETLRRFYALVRPSGPGWAGVRQATPALAPRDDLATSFGGWIASCAFVYGALFGTGFLLVGRPSAAAGALAVCAVSGVVLWRVAWRQWRR
jgi:hypothetical protein